MDSASGAPPDEDDGGEHEQHERPLDALCARHPERRASIVCPLCGSFACGDCTVDTMWGDAMCESCQRHGRAQYPLPWEEAPSPATFVQTAYLVFADTGPLFGSFPAAALRPALFFAALVTALSSLTSATIEHLFAPRHWAASSPAFSSAFFTSLALDVGTSVLLIAICSGVFHGVALLLGGRGTFTIALRATCYLAAVQLLGTLGNAASAMLSGSMLVLVLGLVALFFVVWSLTAIGEQRYRLTRARALCAALAPMLVGALLLAGLVAVVARYLPD